MQVQILSVAGCTECGATRQLLDRLKPQYPDLEVEEVNLAEHPELAERYGLLSRQYDLLSLHGLAIDGELVTTGHVREAELRRALERRAGGREASA